MSPSLSPTRLAITLACAFSLLSGIALGAPNPHTDRFRKLPKGWTLVETRMIPAAQIPAFSRKLGGQIVKGSNTLLARGDQKIKVNIIVCKTPQDAAKAHQAILKAHGGNPLASIREGSMNVVEFVARDTETVERAYAELGFKRPK